MKSDGMFSNIAKYRLTFFVSLLISLCSVFILKYVMDHKEQAKTFKIPGSELIFRLDEANGDYRSLSVYRAGHNDAPGKNRIRMTKNVPWKSMITISTYTPDTVFVSSGIDIVSAINVRIENDSPSVNIRAEGDSRYVRCWFAPMANKMFMATGEETYIEIMPNGIESMKHDFVGFLLYIFVALSIICAFLYKLADRQTPMPIMKMPEFADPKREQDDKSR